MKNPVPILLACLVLSACGGGGSSGKCGGGTAACDAGTAVPTADAASSALPAAVGDARFAASTVYAGQCAAPRPAGTVDPYTRVVYDDRAGSVATELQWIRSFVNETYLWFDEVPAIDLAQYAVGASVPYFEPSDNVRTTRTLDGAVDVAKAFFNSQRTPLLTASGKPKDRFHFTYPTPEWSALSQAGASVGYGFDIALLSARVPRRAVVAYTVPGSTAAANQITRGAEFVTVNGVDAASGADVDTINEALFSPVSGKSYAFEIRDQGSTVTRMVTLTAGPVTSAPVQNVKILPTATGNVGYLVFNDHVATAEAQLIDAVRQFNAADGGIGIRDLILDIRYNGGGFLDIAAELAYMIAGSTRTDGQVFERQSFNRKNPFGASSADDTPFESVAQGFSVAAGTPLPQLALPRVYMLTGADTCSATEAIINGLRGVGVEVILIGSSTCGKPYGFFPQENCGTTYFTIQFKGVNAAGFGDYADGFIPGGTGTAANNLPGCVVADDFSRQLGDPSEGRLAAALHYRESGSCPVASASRQAGVVRVVNGAVGGEPRIVRSALRENRWALGRRRR